MATKALDVRTGRSIWESGRAAGLPHRRLIKDIETDVLVIGAGITGAMIADALAGAGLSVVVVDKRGPAKGATTASTALVQYELDTPLIKLGRRIGKENAVRAWRRSRLAVDALAGRLGELGVAKVERRDSLYLAGDVLNRDELEREHEARQAAGFANRFLDRKSLRKRYKIIADAALLGYGDLVLDPRKATIALLRSATAHKAALFAPVHIIGYEAKRSGVTAEAASGRRIHCRRLVFATGYELPDGVRARGHRLTSTWAIATVPQPRRLWPQQCTIWEASSPYLYLRTTADGRAICGGEDEEFSDEAARDSLLERKAKTIARKLGRLVPGLDTSIAFAWTGTFGESSTGLPTIGAIPGRPNCWIALGYGGNGTTYARIAADVIRGALTGTPDNDASLYDFAKA